MSCSEKEFGFLALKQKSSKPSSELQRLLSFPHPSSFIHSFIQINSNQTEWQRLPLSRGKNSGFEVSRTLVPPGTSLCDLGPSLTFSLLVRKWG